ncbi:PRP1 splicing factor, N-terminal-domain-containing protein, partial [Amylostereum chailletii]
MKFNNLDELSFLFVPAPASYVAGLGRGASGFTTRSDIGPARGGPSSETIASAQARHNEETEVDLEQLQDPDNEHGLFSGIPYEADDEEADKIYDMVEQSMDSRRRARRCAREETELAERRAERPKVQHQFADLKRGLSMVTDSEWESIPEVGNLTRRKRKRSELSFSVPDSVIIGNRSKGEYETSLGPLQQENNGISTPADGTMASFSQARDKVLSLKLDQISGASTSSAIDQAVYLKSIDFAHRTTAEIGNIKRARILFNSLIKSNPNHAPGWISAAALEEHAGHMVTARKLIKAGCGLCPKNEDVWLEAARLHNNDDAKVILANAVQHVGQSVKIWLAAADLEHDVKAKKRVLRKALESIPNSVRLWKETVNLESSAADARILLSRAVEVIPLSVELWIALARLETPERAQAVLNKAHKAVPTSHDIWIAAGRLLEQEAYATKENTDADREKALASVDKTIEAGVKELRRHQVLLTREQWLKEAEKCEADGSPRTCESIVKATVSMEIEEADRFDTWVGDAEAAEARGRVGTARAIIA